MVSQLSPAESLDFAAVPCGVPWFRRAHAAGKRVLHCWAQSSDSHSQVATETLKPANRSLQAREGLHDTSECEEDKS